MKTKILFSVIASLLFINVFADDRTIDEGKTIFTLRCAACHNVNIKVVGPALANVDQRHGIDWIIKFVHSSQTLVKNNDKDAVAVFNEFNKIIMPDHPDLSTDQVKGIVEFIKSQTKIVANNNDAPFERPGKLLPDYLPVSITNYAFFAAYLVVVMIMIASFIVAVKVKEIQRENNNKKGNEIY